jgi:predicted transcriptional regulator
MMAKELMAKYKLTQMETAKRIGVSQPAISLYQRKIRGRAIDLENEYDITALVAKLSESLAKGKLSNKEFISNFCEICRSIRSKGLMCNLHRAFDSTINVEECHLCSTLTTMCTKNS